MSLEVVVAQLSDQVQSLTAQLERSVVRIHDAPLNMGAAKIVTIASGAITVTRPYTFLLPESGVLDDLDTINGGSEGKMVVLANAEEGDGIRIRHYSVSGGNISLRGSEEGRSMGDTHDSVFLVYRDSTGFWEEVGPMTLAQLIDVTYSGSLTTGQVLQVGVSGNWVNGAVPSGGTPGPHATTHQHGGTDEVATATPTGNAIPKADAAGRLANGWLDDSLESLANLGTVADRMAYTTGVDTWAETPITTFGRSLVDDADAAAGRTTLGLVAGGTGDIWVEKAGDTMAGNLDMNSNFIVNLPDPVSAQDAATKAYVDAMQQGLDIKASVRAATTANITLSGAQTIDGVSVVAGDRVLVKNQTTGSQNGIYVAAAGAWSRSTDANTSVEVTAGMYTFVSEGTTQADSGWVLTTNDPINLDTTALVFTQFSGAGQIIDGAGLTKSGNTLSVNVDNSTIEIATDTLQVKNSGITYAKIQNVSASDRILGRVSASAGVIEEIVFTDQAQQLADDTSFSAMRTTLGLGTMATEAAADYVTIAGTDIITGTKSFVRAGSVTIERTGAVTNQLQSSLRLVTTTASPMVDGYGPGIAMLAEDDAGTENPAGIVGWVRNGVDTTYALNIYNYIAGVAELVVEAGSTQWESLLPGFVVGDGTGAPFVAIDGAAGQARSVAWRTAAVNRWILAASATAESGSNAGSDLQLLSRTDAGGTLRTDLTITRSSGLWAIGGSFTMPSGSILTAETIRAVDATGLLLQDDGGNSGVIVNDGGTIQLASITTDVTISKTTPYLNIVNPTDQSVGLGTDLGGFLWTVDDNSVGRARENLAYIKMIGGGTWDGSNSLSRMSFGIHDSALGFINDAMVLLSSGFLGLGTATPVLGIHISDADTNTGVIMERTGTFAGTDTVGIFQARYAGDSLAQMVVARDGANDAASLSFQTQPAGGSLTDRFGAKSNGRFYIGDGITPQGLIHGHDGTFGFMGVVKTGVAATPIVVIPNGTGDVISNLSLLGQAIGSSGNIIAMPTQLANGVSNSLSNGGETIRYRVNADGSFDVTRTAGVETYTIYMWLVWR